MNRQRGSRVVRAAVRAAVVAPRPPLCSRLTGTGRDGRCGRRLGTRGPGAAARRSRLPPPPVPCPVAARRLPRARASRHASGRDPRELQPAAHGHTTAAAAADAAAAHGVRVGPATVRFHLVVVVVVVESAVEQRFRCRRALCGPQRSLESVEPGALEYIDRAADLAGAAPVHGPGQR
ncbi:hypothetical protein CAUPRSCDRAFT_11985 [Caulochytrium protostelioides]|uniref:Uncharacterized protein n=1 Tax=Caulochytrium protostelioides TaxID=1555241 RepID=A0A4P9WUR0_9FUNG|nr:hypothetical protein CAUPRSCDRAFT_11985 [Caulochytrium protostelioides]